MGAGPDAFKGIAMAGPRIVDLGVRDGPMVLFGGPYSNVHALRALLERAAELGIGPRDMICTGDVVAYCGAPSETVVAMRGTGIVTVAGNCERQLAVGAGDCGCGFDEGSVCDLLSAGWFAQAAARIDADQAAWMDGLPDVVTFAHHDARYAVIHGGIRDVARFIWPVSAPPVFADEWRGLRAAVGAVDHIVCGHSGVAFVRDTPDGRWINAGVIGMPPHDGRPDTRFAMLERGEVRIHRLRYDAAGARDCMVAAGLTHGYHDALTTGVWPSQDVLPPEMRR